MKISLLKKNIPLIKLLYFTHIKGKLMWSLDLIVILISTTHYMHIFYKNPEISYLGKRTRIAYPPPPPKKRHDATDQYST